MGWILDRHCPPHIPPQQSPTPQHASRRPVKCFLTLHAGINAGMTRAEGAEGQQLDVQGRSRVCPCGSTHWTAFRLKA